MSKWMQDALCREVGGDLWHPDDGDGQTYLINRALEVCHRCPVELQCLRYALENREMYGVWGGTTQSQRKKLLQLSRKTA